MAFVFQADDGIRAADVTGVQTCALPICKRERKVDIVCLVWTLILGFGNGSKRTLASLRRTYQAASGHMLARSAFYDRLTPALTRLMHVLLQHVLKAQRDTLSEIHGDTMRGFERLLAMDATILRLHTLLAGRYPGCRTNHSPAAAKLHMVMNVVDGSPNRIRLTDERTNDGGPWKRLGRWVKGSLLLFDLGYYDFNFFHRIDQRGGFFVSRLKSTANLGVFAICRTMAYLRGAPQRLLFHMLGRRGRSGRPVNNVSVGRSRRLAHLCAEKSRLD